MRKFSSLVWLRFSTLMWWCINQIFLLILWKNQNVHIIMIPINITQWFWCRYFIILQIILFWPFLFPLQPIRTWCLYKLTKEIYFCCISKKVSDIINVRPLFVCIIHFSFPVFLFVYSLPIYCCWLLLKYRLIKTAKKTRFIIHVDRQLLREQYYRTLSCVMVECFRILYDKNCRIEASHFK